MSVDRRLWSVARHPFEHLHLESLKDIPPDILQFTINDQLFLDTLLMEIRGKSISYSSYKKKTSRKREEKIKQEIISLEQNLSEINSERLELLKKELQLITEDKLKGSIIRSKTKLSLDGEKPSSFFFFCGLE